MAIHIVTNEITELLALGYADFAAIRTEWVNRGGGNSLEHEGDFDPTQAGVYTVAGDRPYERFTAWVAAQIALGTFAEREATPAREGDYRWTKIGDSWAITGTDLVEGVKVAVTRADGSTSVELLGTVATLGGVTYALPRRH